MKNGCAENGSQLILGGSRFLHLTVLCFSPCMTPKALQHQVNSKDSNAYANFNFTGRAKYDWWEKGSHLDFGGY